MKLISEIKKERKENVETQNRSRIQLGGKGGNFWASIIPNLTKKGERISRPINQEKTLTPVKGDDRDPGNQSS